MRNTIKTDSISLKGIFSSIPYEDRIKAESWEDYFGVYQPQKWGKFDSDSCWCLSAINCLEDQLEFLWKKGQFSDEAKTFFTVNGYIDSDGDFSLSERFSEILGGNRDTGGSASQAWDLFGSYGCIPRAQLTYTVEQSDVWSTQKEFDNDYFNVNYITSRMRDLGKQFLKYVNVDKQPIGSNWKTPNPVLLKAAILQAPLQIGIPLVPANWNQAKVTYGGTTNPVHEVELYKYDDVADPQYPYFIYDQYHPEKKQLSKDYYIPLVSQGVVTSNSLPSTFVKPPLTVWQSVWASVFEFFTRKL